MNKNKIAEVLNTIRCEDCKSEYTLVEDSHKISLRKRIEKKMKEGELDDKFRR